MGIVRLRAEQPVGPTLASYAAELDARRYVCPAVLDRRLDLLLDPAGTLRLLAVTGRGGLGKSAALREAARRAERAGRRVVALDARVDDVLVALEAVGDPRPVVLVDEADALGPALGALGPAVAGLPGDARVVVAARSLPARWLPEPLAALAARVRLSGLAAAQADALLGGGGVDDPAARALLVEQAAGLPLALVLAARAWTAAGAAGDGAEAGGRDVSALARSCGDELVAHLADAVLDALEPDLLAVLTQAAGVDVPLLAALFPGRADELVTALRDTSLVEPVGGRLVLHPSLADRLAERIRVVEPERARVAVLRVAEHEHARAVAGESAALPRLAALVADPGIRAGLGPTTLSRHYADRWRPTDAAVVRPALEARHRGLWPVVEPWLGDGTRVVRRADGRPVALVAALPLAEAAGLSGPRRRLVAPVVDRARRTGEVDRAVLSAVQLAFDDAAEPEVVWVRNAAGLSQCGIGNPRSDHVNLVGDLPEECAVLEAYGYAEVVELRREVDGVPVTTWVADVGPGGLAGLLYAAIAAEQGGPRSDADLLAALEDYAGADEPARVWLRARVAELLVAEPALHDLVVRRYLTAGATHESVMRATYLSRATYFRRLRRAREALGAGTSG
ncbi:hypothetical protein [Nocardioides daeguensis]|uniref:ATP-binding protein n=1 Tax=Nocardioides daeguensis TaxID=908359 RepID=A0ABP6V2R5_9ACTN|nr:hypothetical protein [Nocardioides daeguensis]MBV6726551.1 hypothetical protein [Nocardioides daeguensis]MCR1772394.1 hypothetical protein [Nocardioides daeguensis]